jgi:hypothetical protein
MRTVVGGVLGIMVAIVAVGVRISTMVGETSPGALSVGVATPAILTST